jgi:hypothetical protein
MAPPFAVFVDYVQGTCQKGAVYSASNSGNKNKQQNGDSARLSYLCIMHAIRRAAASSSASRWSAM